MSGEYLALPDIEFLDNSIDFSAELEAFDSSPHVCNVRWEERAVPGGPIITQGYLTPETLTNLWEYNDRKYTWTPGYIYSFYGRVDTEDEYGPWTMQAPIVYNHALPVLESISCDLFSGVPKTYYNVSWAPGQTIDVRWDNSDNAIYWPGQSLWQHWTDTGGFSSGNRVWFALAMGQVRYYRLMTRYNGTHNAGVSNWKAVQRLGVVGQRKGDIHIDQLKYQHSERMRV